ncbi:MAG: ABC transporter ATP-binding protein [Chloroflexi bacterium]|nr:ABC transporter ATP-binding protein [Chloroflexota bacterium]
MSFSIGTAGAGMGPRHAFERMGEEAEGRAFDPHVVGRMLGYLRPYRKRMALAFICMFVAAALNLATPYLIKVAIDQYITQGDEPGLNRIALLIGGAFVGIFLAVSAQQYFLSWIGQRVLATLRSQLFRHLQALPLGYHDVHITGVTVSRVINDVAVINDLLSQGLTTLIGDTLILLGTIFVMLSLSPRLALYTLSTIPLMAVVTYLFTSRAKVAFRQTRAGIAAVVGDLAEGISGMRVIQAFAQETASGERFERVNRVNRDAYVSAMSLSYIFLPTVEFLGMLATGIVLWFGGLAVVGGAVTLGVIVAFMAYVTRFFTPIQELSQLYTTMQAAMAGGERVIELLDTVPDVRDLPGAAEMPRINGRIELHDVSFAYRDGPQVLHNVNLVVEPGQVIALVGPTGAGKSSIANLVARFYDVVDGEVLIDGIDVRSVTQKSLRQQMALVPQDPILFSGTIADNIRFGRPGASEDEIIAAARLAETGEFIDGLPKGYETEIMEGGANLSVGQRQLISIARAALANPRILIMDEATASVDTVTEALIQEALKILLAGRTSIIIAHRLSTIRNADLICVIQGGRIVERGTHRELLAHRGLYHELYERQFMDVTVSTNAASGI